MAVNPANLVNPEDPVIDSIADREILRHMGKYAPLSICNTFLSSSIREHINNYPDFNIQADGFSWKHPDQYGLQVASPTPRVLNQGDRSECVAYGLWGLLTMHMKLIASLNLEGVAQVPEAPVAEASLDHLLLYFTNLTKVKRTATHMLDILFDHGFVDVNGFMLNARRVAPNAPRYFVHWVTGFEASEGTEDYFNEKLKDAIVRRGGVLADYWITSTFDHEGNEPATNEGESSMVQVGRKRKWTKTLTRARGHTVFLTGWRLKDGITQWEYQNSWGATWGEDNDGFGWLCRSAINHVYIFQVLRR